MNSEVRALTIVAAHEGQGNISPHTDKLLPALVRNSYRVRFLGWDRNRLYPRRSSIDGVDFEMLFRGGGYASRKVALWLPFWFLRVFVALVARRPPLTMAIDFEAALPTALASALTRRAFIYNCRDNVAFRSSYPAVVRPLLAWLDLRLMRRAVSIILPDENRVPSDDAGLNVTIVRNCAPDVRILDEREPAWLTIYAMGYLRSSRGVDVLLDACAVLEGVRVIAAGQCPEPELEQRLRTADRVEYLGSLSAVEALGVCGRADLVLTFYSPDSEINRRAVSNKWSDAMMAGRAILVNEEVQRSRWILDEGIGFACRYDVDALREKLSELSDDRDSLDLAGRRGRTLYEQGYSWAAMEQRVMQLLHDAEAAAAGAGGLGRSS